MLRAGNSCPPVFGFLQPAQVDLTSPSSPTHTAMFAAALLCQALLATAALAIPSSRERFAARLARRDGSGFDHQSQPSQLVDSASVTSVNGTVTNGADAANAKVSYSGNWAGAVISEKKVCHSLMLLPQDRAR